MYSKDKIKAALNSKGYRWFAGKNYDVNIVGIRNSQTLEHVTNKFDDLMTISYRDECGEWNYFEFECTTDPGKHWVENLMNESGVAIVKDLMRSESTVDNTMPFVRKDCLKYIGTKT